MDTTRINQPLLLVEDNPMDLELTLHALTSRKLTNPIEVARDGEEALAYFGQWEKGNPIPVVILLDLKLPKVSGLEVLEIIKGHPIYKTIPVVILTTSSETSDMERAYKLGANSYIVKPVDFDKFMEVAGQIELYWSVLNKPFCP
ncbi:MAG: response regulator [Candidatus Saccharibacteria bacterium]